MKFLGDGDGWGNADGNTSWDGTNAIESKSSSKDPYVQLVENDVIMDQSEKQSNITTDSNWSKIMQMKSLMEDIKLASNTTDEE